MAAPCPDSTRGSMISVAGSSGVPQRAVRTSSHPIIQNPEDVNRRDATDDVGGMILTAFRSPPRSMLMMQESDGPETSATLQKLLRASRIEHLEIRPQTLFGSDSRKGMAYRLSVLQSLVGLQASSSSMPDLRFYHKAWTTVITPSFLRVSPIELFRLMPSPGSLCIERAPVMRMATIFGRLGEKEEILL